jgi:hypothetical protein
MKPVCHLGVKTKETEVQVESIGPYTEYEPAHEKAMEFKSSGEIIREIKQEGNKWFIKKVVRV